MTLATTGPDGSPQAAAPHCAAVYFAARPLKDDDLQGLRLYFFSDPDSQHGQDLRTDPRAAAALYPEVSSWQEIRGVQLRGTIYILPAGAALEAAWELYRAKFPFVNGLKAIVQRNALYVFSPTWVRLVDNRRGFGFKQEWDLVAQDG